MTHRALLTALALVIVALFAADPLADVTHGATPASYGATPDVWGNLDCKGGVTAADAIVILGDAAGVYNGQAQYCPALGSTVSVDGVPNIKFGDLNCDGTADFKDSLALLGYLAGATATTEGGCYAFGASIQLAQITDAYEPGDAWRDFGDAPDGVPTDYASGAAIGNFPTLPAHGGPSHLQEAGATLGENSSVEEAPVANDENNGIVYLNLHACAASSALVMINTEGLTADQRAAGVYLSMFADWNKDGAWTGTGGCAPEAAVVNQKIDVTDAQNVDLVEIDFMGGVQVDEFWSRFILTTQPYTAGAQDLQGETEDYHVVAGQVPTAGDGLAQPQDDDVEVSADFFCKGTIVPHGDGATMTLVLEQTQKSKQSGFKIQNWKGTTGGVTKPAGAKVGDVSVASSGVKIENLKDGRVQILITMTVTSKHDSPNRLVGPLETEVKFTGKTLAPKVRPFKGSITCVFYVDHTDGASTQDPKQDGFKGGASRSDDGPGIQENKYIFIQHGDTKTIKSDATDSNTNDDPAHYDAKSLTVFGPDGNVVPKANVKKDAGVSDITVPIGGRGLVIKTTEDKRKEPVQMIIVRISGKTDNGAEFTDYYRIVIVHDKGANFKKLVKQFTEDPKFAGTGKELGPDESYAVTYVDDGQSLVSFIPADEGLTFGPETICVEDAGDGRSVLSPISYASYAEDLSPTSDGATPQLQSDELRGGYVLRYSTGATDFFGVYDPFSAPEDPAPPCDDPSTATNLTGYGPSSIFAVEHPSWCYNAYLFAELNEQTDSARLAYFQHSGPFPLPGGDNFQDGSCFFAPNETIGVTARRMNGDNISDAWYVPYCVPACPTDTLPNTAKLLIGATAANENILGAVVSPDSTKITWAQATLTADGKSFVDGQIMEADFDLSTLTLSNTKTLTTKGLNLHPQWSPDSLEIVFDSQRDGNSEIYAMAADGDKQTNLTNTPDIDETQPAWQTP